MRHPEIITYEQIHNVHVYGSGITYTKAGWRCRDKDSKNYVWAATLDQLVAKAPHCVKHPKPIRQPKQPAAPKPSKPFVRRRPYEITNYETTHNVLITGFNVQKRQDHWICMPETKKGPLRTFKTLEELIATCPYVLSPKNLVL